MGGGAVHSHEAEVDRRGEEGHDQRTYREHQEVVAQDHAVQDGVSEERGSCTVDGHLLHPGAEHEHQCQLTDGKQEVKRIDQIDKGRGRRDIGHCEGDKQAAGHPAVGAGHIVRCAHRRLRIAAVIVVVIHKESSIQNQGIGLGLAPVYEI